jgi:hypothetical protein
MSTWEIERLGWVAVAYLDEAGGLVACHGIRIWAGENPLLAVAADAECREYAEVLVGRAAELLHIAVTGRLVGELPDVAGAWSARRAREALACNLDRVGFAEAYGAVALWGDFIVPWYGVCRLDERGRPLLDLSEYTMRLDIPIVEEVFNGRAVEGLERGGGAGGSERG